MGKRIRTIGLLAAISLGVSLTASAQGRGFAGRTMGGGFAGRGISGIQRGGLAPGRGPAVFGAPGVFRGGFGLGSFGLGGFRGGFGFVPPLVGSPLNPNFAPIFGAPGLGFDFQHLAAIERPALNRFGHRRGFFPFFPSFAPLFFNTLPLDYSGYSYPCDPNYYSCANPCAPNDYACLSNYNAAVPDFYTQSAQQPQYLIPRPYANVPSNPAPSATTETPPPPAPDLGQLILVRRDGQVLLVVAFTVRDRTLTYITKEGARLSFPVSDLDKQATRQMNEADGTSISLPD
jgi:hypothetical protein